MIFDAKSETEYNRIIKNLAKKYLSVPFQPHLTLAGVPDWPEQKIIEAIGQIAVNTPQFELSAKTVRCKTFPYQKLALEVEKTKGLVHLHQKTDAVFEGEYSQKEYPHISLLYSSVSCGHFKKELNDIEKNTLRKVFGSQIALVRCKGTPEEWKTLYEWQLSETKV